MKYIFITLFVALCVFVALNMIGALAESARAELAKNEAARAQAEATIAAAKSAADIVNANKEIILAQLGFAERVVTVVVLWSTGMVGVLVFVIVVLLRREREAQILYLNAHQYTSLPPVRPGASYAMQIPMKEGSYERNR